MYLMTAKIKYVYVRLNAACGNSTLCYKFAKLVITSHSRQYGKHEPQAGAMKNGETESVMIIFFKRFSSHL